MSFAVLFLALVVAVVTVMVGLFCWLCDLVVGAR